MAKKTAVKLSKRKFYQTIVTIEVLSEEPVSDKLEPGELWRECLDGGYSGKYEQTEARHVNGKIMARLLKKQGSCPWFFKLTEKGEDVDES